MKKVILNGYILGIGNGSGGIEIADDEAEMLIAIFANKPIAADGYDYRLKADLSWELYELPPVPEDDELTAEEALEIISGGVSDETK